MKLKLVSDHVLSFSFSPLGSCISTRSSLILNADSRLLEVLLAAPARHADGGLGDAIIERRRSNTVATGGATGYSAVRKRGLTWAGAKVHMGNNQEAYDAECAALAHALELAAQRSTTPERVAIFSDAQAAIRRMASDEPGPGQQYALQARKHIATLRRARKGIVIEIRWCPAHKGVAGNEKADEWAKIAAGVPNTRGVEWLSSSGRTEVRAAPLPRTLASLKREISEKKWA